MDSCVELRDQFIGSVGESKLYELNPQLVYGSYVRMYQGYSRILAQNNGGKDIKSLTEALGSLHKVNLEKKVWMIKKMELLTKYLKDKLLR